MAHSDVISLKHTIQRLLRSVFGNEMAAYVDLPSLNKRTINHLSRPHCGGVVIEVPAVAKLYIILHDAVESLQQVLEIVHNRDEQEQQQLMIWKIWEPVEPLVLKRFPFEYSVVRSTSRLDVPSLYDFLAQTRVDCCSEYDHGRMREAVSGLVDVLESLLISNIDEFAGELDNALLIISSFQDTVNTIVNHGKKKSMYHYYCMVKLLLGWSDHRKSFDFDDEFPRIMELLLEIQKYGHKELKNLEVGIRRLDMGRSNTSREILDALEVKIGETMRGLEDLLETRVLSHLLNPQTEETMTILEETARLNQYEIDDESIISSLNSLLNKMNHHDELQRYFLPFIESVSKLKLEYITELIDPFPEKDDESEDSVSPIIDFLKVQSTMVGGLHDDVVDIKYQLIEGKTTHKLKIISIFGMAGIGKTTLAKEVFKDPYVSGYFERAAWVNVGQNYQIEKIMHNIIAQVGSNVDTSKGDGERSILEERLRVSLEGVRYLIVLDDVWNESARNDITRLFPDDTNKSRVLLTTRIRQVALSGSLSNELNEMHFMSEEDSWDLLRKKVFSHDQSTCPLLLVDAGKKIANSCEGLPLTIVTVGDLLSKVEKTPEHWNRVAVNPNPLLEEAYDQMLKVLLMSYNFLPQHLKACFLYMGVFPQNHQIPRSEIIKLWAVERLFDEKVDRKLVFRTTMELVGNSILMPGICSSSLGRKTWSLHPTFWYLCKRESSKKKFFHTISSYNDGISESIKGQHRLCVHKNILFGIKDVNKSMSSISTVRSLLCTGPPHPYPVPICLGLSLLRVLNALTIRLYEFPMEVVKLVGLNYLALTCHGNLPSSISKLRKIQFLIVHKYVHLGIISSPSYLPNEIWDMRELKHLQIMGSNLPDPCDGGSLPKLKKLLDVGPHSCTSRVLQALPKLNKLGIRIELAHNVHDAEPTLHCFDHISHLQNLKELKCVVVNPTFGSHIVPPPLPIFPLSLERLSLSGLGYPWEDMRLISWLPNLGVLKLRCHAFRGPKWEIKDDGFPKLEFLLIEDSDLVHWTAGRTSMPCIFRMFLSSCYKLENIPRGDSKPLVGLLNCNLDLSSAQQGHGYSLGSDLYSSFDDCLQNSKHVRTEIDEITKLSFNFLP